MITNGSETIPSDAIKIASETLRMGIKSNIGETVVIVCRYENVAKTNKKSEAPMQEIVMRI